MPHTGTRYYLRGTLPNTPLAVSIISALLGGVVFTSLALALSSVWRSLGSVHWTWARPQLGFYLAFMGVFHLMEFFTTAGWNASRLSVDAFLLNNTRQYHLAHAVGLLEYFISSWLFPSKFNTPFASLPFLGIVTLVLVAAQTLRSLAMIHASASFAHIVQTKKHDDHVLITSGVYAYVRHPSYCAFFYWAVATQILLGNVVSTLAFVVVLRRFFGSRIEGEEKHLVSFFGDEYVQYRQRVPTGVPFVYGY
ncbi:protein-S-isoprenylcysteine O-methyltransferase, partial [Tremellales sp. Uapishka_1]